jgi:hypothetical protein
VISWYSSEDQSGIVVQRFDVKDPRPRLCSFTVKDTGPQIDLNSEKFPID